MSMKHKIIVPILFLCLLAAFVFFPGEKKYWEVSSPEGQIIISVGTKTENSNGAKSKRLVYWVHLVTESGEKVPALNESPLGIDLASQQFTNDLRFVSAKPICSINEEYTMVSGKQSKCNNKGNELELTFKNNEDSTIQFIFRAYNDGVAFKYRIAGAENKQETVIAEHTGFAVPQDGEKWIHPYADASQWGPAYERNFASRIPVGTRSRDSIGWAFPVLFKTDDCWMLISEAGLTRNYCGSHLQQHARNGLYKIRFPESNEARGKGQPRPESFLPIETPWRVIIIGESPATVIESTLITDVSEPSKIKDTSWIKPGKASWSWLHDHGSTRDFNEQIKYVDFAADMNWQYSLIDAGWPDMKGGTMEGVVKYAAKKNIGILLWYRSGGDIIETPESPGYIMSDPIKRKLEFKRLNELGVKGIKVDFFHSDNQFMVNLYLDILKDAADHQLLVVFHGCTLPRGWHRTWPNLMSMEAVRGAECYLWDPRFPAEAPMTNFAHELALSVIFESGIQHMGDHRENYLKQPEYVIDFLKDVPVAWDETHYIQGEPDNHLILARRKGNTWYIAGINSYLKKEVTFRLPFLQKGKTIEIISDGDNNKDFLTRKWQFEGDDIVITMLPNGGFAGKIIL